MTTPEKGMKFSPEQLDVSPIREREVPARTSTRDRSRSP